MSIDYEKINNGNGWNTQTSLGPTNLNHMEQGIKDACDGVDEIKDSFIPKENLTSEDIRINVGGVTWTRSARGLYYYSSDVDATNVVSMTLAGWGGLASAVVPSFSASNKISFICDDPSNNSATAYIIVRIIKYIQ